MSNGLSDKEIVILSAAETGADLACGEIAKRAGVREHVARRILDSLHARGIIRRHAYFDSYLLGHSLHLVFLRLLPDKQSRRSPLLAFLKRSPEVSFVADVGGTFHICAEIRTKSLSELQAFLDRLAQTVGNIFRDKEILSMLALTDFPIFRGKGRAKSQEFSIATSSRKVSVDLIDQQLLKLLAESWELTTTAMARQLKIPQSTIEYRLKRLRKEGLLVGIRYLVDLLAIGEQPYYHLIATRGLSQKLRTSIIEFCRESLAVHAVRTTLGRWDFVIESHFQQSETNIEFCQTLMETFSDDISDMETIPVMSLQKISDCTMVD